MLFTNKIEREIDNMLKNLEMDSDVETAMEIQLEKIEENPDDFQENDGFTLMDEENPECGLFPQPYHTR